MTAFVVCSGPRPRFVTAIACLALAVAVLASPPASAVERDTATSLSDPVTVEMDQAKLLKLPEKTATVVIGNPLIADVAVQPGGIMVVTAKGYGMTNLVALDRSGSILIERPIQVVAPTENVVMYRGVERESYSCKPICERRILIGDSQLYFTNNLTQGMNLNVQAQAAQK